MAKGLDDAFGSAILDVKQPARTDGATHLDLHDPNVDREAVRGVANGSAATTHRPVSDGRTVSRVGETCRMTATEAQLSLRVPADGGEPTTLGQRLHAARLRSGMSRQEAARRLGASLAVVCRWEEGNAAPSPSQQAAIDVWYECDVPPDLEDAFASRGLSGRSATTAPEVELAEEPGPAILSRLMRQAFFGPSDQVSAVLARHAETAPTATRPPASGISAGKNTYTYDAHTYHTKVPPQGIAELLAHYLPEGGLVLDPFAGSGMTGVAASVRGLDCVLNELSPAAAFIASRFTQTIDPAQFAGAVQAVLSRVADLRKLLYKTRCRECGLVTELLYTVWSYRVVCYECSGEFQLWDACRSYGRTVREHKILTEFPCPLCDAVVRKSRLGRTAPEPVQVGYKCCGSKQQEVTHPPSADDLSLIRQLESSPPVLEGFYPTHDLPDGVNLGQPRRHGLTSIDKFYTPRNLAALSHLWREIHCIEDTDLAGHVAFAFTSLYRRVTRLSEFRFWGGSGNTARLNVPYIFDEPNVFVSFARKARTIQDHLDTTARRYKGSVVTRVGSATELDLLPDDSVDLIFTDPPFGANINYSEMNLLWESWLGRRTETDQEAIVNRVQGKDASRYGDLMTAALAESYRVLRPGHWLLMVFMNSSALIWQEIRQAIDRAGFLLVTADIFDKQHGTFKHFVSENTPGADLVFHCLKPAHARGSTGGSRLARPELREFLAAAETESYVQRFLHVSRPAEPDLRRLYAEWLSRALVTGGELVDFADFRAAATEQWGVEFSPVVT